MQTECNAEQMEFASIERRRVVASFDGGRISSEGGLVLLQRADRRLRLLDRLAECFQDRRREEAVEHSVCSMLGQRIFALRWRMRIVNDHEQLRSESVVRAALGKLEAQRSELRSIGGVPCVGRVSARES